MSGHPSTLEHLLLFYARRFPVRRGKLRVIDSLWRKAAGRQSTLRLAQLKHGGLQMNCDLSELLQRQLYFFGTYFVEEYILACWMNEVRGARVVFDVGANAGIYSLAALSVQRDCDVHAFEPTPEIVQRLRQTAILNGLQQRLHVHELAVSDRYGQAALVRSRGALGSNEGMNFINAETIVPTDERVTTVNLDRFCAERSIDRIDLLKLDIQGHEHHALMGALCLLQSGRIGTVFTELNWSSDDENRCPASASIRLLQAAGYRFSKPGARLEWHMAGDWLRGLSDVVARRVTEHA